VDLLLLKPTQALPPIVFLFTPKRAALEHGMFVLEKIGLQVNDVNIGLGTGSFWGVAKDILSEKLLCGKLSPCKFSVAVGHSSSLAN